MAEQYFTENPNTKHDLRVIDYHLAGVDLKLATDAGVFSKNRVDHGNGVLIRNTLEEDLVSGNTLDAGCGYGPIGLLATKKWPDRQADMVDANEQTVDLARKNTKINDVTSVNIFASSTYENTDKQYAMILTNPPIRVGKNIVSEILGKSYEYLLIGRKLLVAIQKGRGAPSAKELMETIFGNCEIAERDKGHYILGSVK